MFCVIDRSIYAEKEKRGEGGPTRYSETVGTRSEISPIDVRSQKNVKSDGRGVSRYDLRISNVLSER